MTPDPIDVALAVTSVLERLDIPYAIGGSVAGMIHGEPRLTNDVDLAAALDPEHVDPLLEGIRGAFHADRKPVDEAVRDGGAFNLLHLESLLKVDVYIPARTGFPYQQILRRQRVVLRREPERSAYVATPEDVLLQKLAWYRKGNERSDRQWRDILGILNLQAGRIDETYLDLWAVEAGVADLLERARIESGQPPGKG